MSAGRHHHSALKLNDGSVLVVGGNPGISPPGQPERFDPASLSWKTTGPLSDAPAADSPALVLLEDGRVLATLDPVPDATTTDVAVFLPGTNTWQRKAPLPIARSRHTFSKLRDGRVLVTGGVLQLSNQRLDDCQLFDPATNLWTRTGSLPRPLSQHTATVLNDGRVLIVGGAEKLSDGVATAVSQLFDPSTGTWTETAPLSEARWGHRAALLADGRVLVVGGQTAQAHRITAELYDPVSGTWSNAGELEKETLGHFATELPRLADGRVVVSSEVGITEVFDPSARTWSRLSQRPIAEREGHSATGLDDGRVLIIGGANHTGFISGP